MINGEEGLEAIEKRESHQRRPPESASNIRRTRISDQEPPKDLNGVREKIMSISGLPILAQPGNNNEEKSRIRIDSQSFPNHQVLVFNKETLSLPLRVMGIDNLRIKSAVGMQKDTTPKIYGHEDDGDLTLVINPHRFKSLEGSEYSKAVDKEMRRGVSELIWNRIFRRVNPAVASDLSNRESATEEFARSLNHPQRLGKIIESAYAIFTSAVFYVLPAFGAFLSILGRSPDIVSLVGRVSGFELSPVVSVLTIPGAILIVEMLNYIAKTANLKELTIPPWHRALLANAILHINNRRIVKHQQT